MKLYDGGTYDIIVIGGGHGGCEAALASARIGYETLLLTINLDGIALMACNPSIGGTAKGHLVREIDALGGQMGLTADATFMQIKMLNMGKGPAVQSLRAQQDKKKYQQHMKWTLENTENLTVKQGEAVRLDVKDGRICGVVTECGAYLHCKALVMATGVYLKSRIIIGEYTRDSGPSGLQGAYSLSSSLKDLGFSLMRFKTGTPARVDRRTLDFDKLEPQLGDQRPLAFSFLNVGLKRPQIPCYLTYTNETTHEIIRQNIHRSPLFSGEIKGTGPRYCPSIEDKVMKFPHKDRHQLFLEPEGEFTNEMYVQGMSSSLPEEVQIQIYRSIPGMERVQFTRTAYAIEYDCIDPTSLKLSLESREIAGLFFAGQINGSSGYEEAAAQGLIAGINAAMFLREREPLILGRDQAYTGVLIDDLVTKGTREPYRMMTSRAEYRLLLRQDNADARLTELGRDIGLVSQQRYDRYQYKCEAVNKGIKELNASVKGEQINRLLLEKGEQPIAESVRLSDLMRRPALHLKDLLDFVDLEDFDDDIGQQIENTVKYKGYIEKQERQVEKFRSLENKKLPRGVDYEKINGLRLEARAKLNQLQPENMGQAARISGVSPSDVAVLTVYFASMKGR